jgi:hypothetical protein
MAEYRRIQDRAELLADEAPTRTQPRGQIESRELASPDYRRIQDHDEAPTRIRTRLTCPTIGAFKMKSWRVHASPMRTRTRVTDHELASPSYRRIQDHDEAPTRIRTRLTCAHDRRIQDEEKRRSGLADEVPTRTQPRGPDRVPRAREPRLPADSRSRRGSDENPNASDLSNYRRIQDEELARSRLAEEVPMRTRTPVTDHELASPSYRRIQDHDDAPTRIRTRLICAHVRRIQDDEERRSGLADEAPTRTQPRGQIESRELANPDYRRIQDHDEAPTRMRTRLTCPTPTRTQPRGPDRVPRAREPRQSADSRSRRGSDENANASHLPNYRRIQDEALLAEEAPMRTRTRVTDDVRVESRSSSHVCTFASPHSLGLPRPAAQWIRCAPIHIAHTPTPTGFGFFGSFRRREDGRSRPQQPEAKWERRDRCRDRSIRIGDLQPGSCWQNAIVLAWLFRKQLPAGELTARDVLNHITPPPLRLAKPAREAGAGPQPTSAESKQFAKSNPMHAGPMTIVGAAETTKRTSRSAQRRSTRRT